MIYKIMNALYPINLRRRLVTRSQISNYPTRNQLDLDTASRTQDSPKAVLFYSGAKTWNEIALEIRINFVAWKQPVNISLSCEVSG